jgi:hypothetical protein
MCRMKQWRKPNKNCVCTNEEFMAVVQDFPSPREAIARSREHWIKLAFAAPISPAGGQGDVERAARDSSRNHSSVYSVSSVV